MSNYGQMQAIPTIYNGFRFRSRLEATWAAFFDELGWQWEYEPCDFNGWIPDFLILGAKKVWVEVKPVTDFPEEIASEIDRSGACGDALILGLAPIRNVNCTHQDFLGWLGEYFPDCGRDWGFAPFGKYTPEGPIGFCHEHQSFHDRITGVYQGGSWGIYDHAPIREMWAKAKNQVQYKGQLAVY